MDYNKQEDKADKEDYSEGASHDIDWKECIDAIDDVKELDYISSIASARRQVLDAEKRKNEKPPKKGDNPHGFPTEVDYNE